MTITTIPVRETVRSAWRMSLSNWRELFKISALPCLVMALPAVILVSALLQITDFKDAKDLLGAPNTNMCNHIFTLIGMFVAVWMQVAALRYLILGEKSKLIWPNYNKRIWRYIWKKIVVAFCCLVFFICAAAILGIFDAVLSYAIGSGIAADIVSLILALVFLLFFFLAVARICLAVTATAVTDENSLKSAWVRTRGQALRIGTIGFFAGLRLLLPYLILGALSAVIYNFAGKNVAMILGLIGMWVMAVYAQIVFLPVSALLYGHFYPDQNQQSPDLGAEINVGGTVAQ